MKILVHLKFFFISLQGVQNITAIGNVIQWQKVEYDFQFHKCDMKTDIVSITLISAHLTFPSNF